MQFERAKAALAGTRFADFRTVEETGSTNADMVEILRTQDPTEDRRPAVLVADHQSAGRGRRDRTWDAPPGSSLLMSIGLPVGDIDRSRWPLVNAAVALAAVDAAPDLRIKWPNDLVWPGDGSSPDRKLAGILAESVLSYLGLGVQPPLPSWGNMLTGAQELLFEAPLLALWPGLLIFATVLAFNLLGDRLEVALDPRQRGSRN